VSDGVLDLGVGLVDVLGASGIGWSENDTMALCYLFFRWLIGLGTRTRLLLVIRAKRFVDSFVDSQQA